MTELRKEIALIDARIAANKKVQRDAEDRIKTLYAQRSALFCDSGLLPEGLRSAGENARLRKMPFWDFDCEYCGSTNVRKGKQIVCIDCLHVQGGVKVEEKKK